MPEKAACELLFSRHCEDWTTIDAAAVRSRTVGAIVGDSRKFNPGAWMAIGIGVGTAIGVAMGNLAIGVGLGAALGALLMAAVRKRQD